MKDPREYVSYEPEAGVFRWIRRPGHRGRGHGKIGAVAGHIDNRYGYLTVCVGGVRHAGHRLAWYLMTGAFPPGMVDHINGNPSDNRWANLRLATPQQNATNRAALSSTGFKGVALHKCGKYQAQIKVDGKSIYLGLHPTAEGAAAAYQRAATHHFGEYAREMA